MSTEHSRPKTLENTNLPGDGVDPAAVESCRTALLRRIEKCNLQVPVLPGAASQIMSLTTDPNADLGELSELIHQDQTLAGHVLRIANSAYYGGGETIVSLQQAVTRLGMGLLSEIAMAVSVGGGVFTAEGFADEAKLMWRHALASGTYGKEVARMKRQNVEGQFLCGLMHTVGRPVALQAISEWLQENKTSFPIHVVRNLVAQFDLTIGVDIAEKWKLPNQVQTGCAHYRRYAEAPTFKDETAMTYLADRLAGWVVELDGVDPDTLRSDPVFGLLNLYPDDVDELLEKKESILEVVNTLDL